MRHAASEDDKGIASSPALWWRSLGPAVGRIWRMVPEARILRSDELRERLKTQRPRAEKVRSWLLSFGWVRHEAISEKRLEVDPTYLLCVNCAL